MKRESIHTENCVFTPGGKLLCSGLEFVLVEQTSRRSLRLQIKDHVQDDPRSHSSDAVCCFEIRAG